MNKKSLAAAIFILLAAALLLRPEITSAAVKSGLQICISNILPSIFPFAVLTNLWNSLGLSDWLGKKCAKITQRIFHLPGICACALITGSLGGFPLGAVSAAELYRQGKLNKESTEKLLVFCSNAGPAFIISVLGAQLFDNILISLSLWVIHLIGAIITGYILRPSCSTLSQGKTITPKKQDNIFLSFTNSIKYAGEIYLHICFFILAFRIMLYHIQSAVPVHISQIPLFSLVLSFLELTSGCLSFQLFSPLARYLLSAVLLAWNGICVHCQVLSVTMAAGLDCKEYFIGKAVHILVSLILSVSALPFLPLPMQTHGIYIPVMLFLPIGLVLIFLLRKTSTGKIPHIHI